MAEKLLLYYKYMSDQKGITGKVRLAQLTKIPSIVAAIEPDSPDLVRLFCEAVEKLTGNVAPKF